MPMLAERRRKTKWTNFGRQALWKRDSGDATFGREMMEKMGWKVGQGLGVNEQGIKEPLRISFKNDNKGVGFKDNDNEWIQQQSEFDEFLNKLSTEKKELSKDSQTNTVQSLEERSRLSKARVHYHKFTRGKDLTKYSKKDLECILGRNEKESSEISGNVENWNENNGNEDKSLITAGSMVDYFAKKMQSKKKKKDDSLNIKEHEVGESSLGSRSKDETEENMVESTMELDVKKKKKSKKKKEKDEGGCNEAPCDEMDTENNDYKMKSSSEGGKKSKKTTIVQELAQSDHLSDSRRCEDETAENELIDIAKEEETENVDESTMEVDVKKKKKSKKKKEKDEGGCNEAPCDEMDTENNDYKMKSSSEGGKKSKKTTIVQELAQSDHLSDSRRCEDETAENELIDIAKEEETENVDESTMELDVKKKKKSKKKKEKDEGGCNETPCDEMDTENSDYKMKSSSEGGKKSKKTTIVQELAQSDHLSDSRRCEDETAENELIDIAKEEKENVNDKSPEGDVVLGEKIKKKKKKRKKEENLIEHFDTENVEALNVLENKDGECEETQEKACSLTSAEGVRMKNKTSKRDHRVITDEDDDGASEEKIKRKKKCIGVENRFNYKDCGTNENYLNPVSHTETNFKKEKENCKTKCESAVGTKQETRKDGRERIAGEDPLYYKGELLKKENSLRGTSRNKLLNLIYSTNIEHFSGSNLGRLSGYGILSHR